MKERERNVDSLVVRKLKIEKRRSRTEVIGKEKREIDVSRFRLCI